MKALSQLEIYSITDKAMKGLEDIIKLRIRIAVIDAMEQMVEKDIADRK